MRTFEKRLRPWEIKALVRRRKRFIKLFNRWMLRTGHDLSRAAWRAGIATSTLGRVLTPPTKEYMVNPGEAVMFRLCALAGIDDALRERRRKNKRPKKPYTPTRKNRGFARRAGR